MFVQCVTDPRRIHVTFEILSLGATVTGMVLVLGGVVAGQPSTLAWFRRTALARRTPAQAAPSAPDEVLELAGSRS